MKPYALLFIGLMLAGCSPSRMGVQVALPLLESQGLAMQKERDPELAKQVMPANLKTLEGLFKQDPDNTWILENLAKGFCGYAFSFLEGKEPKRAPSFILSGWSAKKW